MPRLCQDFAKALKFPTAVSSHTRQPDYFSPGAYVVTSESGYFFLRERRCSTRSPCLLLKRIKLRTQAFGAMYLGSFLIIEILVIPTQKQLDRSSARRKEKVEDDVPSQPLITTADDDAAANQTEIELSFDHLEPSSAAPRTLPLWLSSVEDGIPRQPGSTSVAIPPSSRIEAWISFLSRSFSYGVSYSCIYWVLVYLILDAEDQSDLAGSILPSAILIVTFPYFTFAAAVFWVVPGDNTLFVDLLIWAHTLAYVLFAFVLDYSYVVVICVSCISTSAIGFYSIYWNLDKHLTKFLIAHKIEDISYWFFFLHNFIAAILWYCYIYNPAGTIKPFGQIILDKKYLYIIS